MNCDETRREAVRRFEQVFGRAPSATAYAPGRVEVIGNHTDYNEGYVLSAAIDMGTFFLAARRDDGACRLTAGDLMRTVEFPVADPRPDKAAPWANYVKGIVHGLTRGRGARRGFDALFLGNLPLGAGLSSSAALEMSAGLALGALFEVRLDRLAMARLGQAAEHEFAGVKCGLLDQITSLFARAGSLVMTDFRALTTEDVPLGGDAVFLMCNTAVKHALVDGEYNRRRRSCEKAAACFASVLDHPVKALRDVAWHEWERHAPAMEPVAARRAAHVIGENTRVLRGRELLAGGRLEEFGRLMFASHESSRVNFENSCPELDFLVKTAGAVPGVLGARLSGGGFGGSAVVLIHPRDAEVAGHALTAAYAKEFGHPCDVRAVTPSEGARLMEG
ncbi:MAG: galactokinase [Lentisphaerae bacterium]|nr:galactokinase [Lentisphaerota bacterium]